MFKKHIPAYAVAAVLSFSFAACRGSGSGGGGCVGVPPCADCGPTGGGAVLCCTGPFGTNCQAVCAPDEDLAAIQCSEAGGTYSSLAVCIPAPPAETAGDDDTGGTET